MQNIVSIGWRVLVSILVIFLFSPGIPAVPARAALPAPFLVADLKPNILQHSYPHPFLPAGPFAYFFTYNYGHKQVDDMAPRLYQTDGTPQGTRVVKFFGPGDQGGSATPYSAEFGGQLFFTAYDHAGGNDADLSGSFSVWRTDGSEQGTQRVGVDSTPHGEYYASGYTVFNEKLFFVNQRQIFFLDDPFGQPLLLAEVNSPLSLAPPALMALGDRLYFAWYDPQHGYELWESDGTPAGTHKLIDLVPGSGSSYAVPLLVFQERLYFKANGNGADGHGLWSYQPALNQFTRLHTLSSDSIRGAAAAGEWVYFGGYEPLSGHELYRTNGLTTEKVADINPGAGSSNPWLIGSVNVAGQPMMLFFASGADGKIGVWVSDGTLAGTVRIMGPLTPSNYETVNIDGKYYFGADDGTHGFELWQTDGTPTGTVLLKDVLPGGQGSYPSNFGVCADRFCFSADDGVHGYEPWSSDGTPAGTQMLVDANQSPASSDPRNPLAAGGKLYFLAKDQYANSNVGVSAASSLYRVGSEPGAERLFTDANLTIDHWTMAALGSQVYFIVDKGSTVFELWWISGPDQMPELVKTITNDSFHHLMQAYHGKMYFAFEGALWYSNGNPAETQVWRSSSIPINYLTVFNDLLLFGNYDWRVSGNPTNLYATDGLEPVSTWLGQLPGRILSSAQIEDRLLINVQLASADTGMLWQLDAPSMSLQPVPAPACLGSYGLLNRLTALDDTFFFYDLSADGTRLTLLTTVGVPEEISCVWSTTLPSGGNYYRNQAPMTTFQEKVFFEAPGADGVRQMWLSDGTSEGTQPLPGQNSTAPGLTTVSSLLAAPTGLFFSAGTPARGRELWFWDGSQPPRLAADLRAGSASSGPELMGIENGLLYFVANDGHAGREPWAYDISQVPSVSADFTFTPSAGIAPLAVQFTNGSSGYIDTLAWDFDDGVTSSEPNPVHTFSTAGQYSVTLTVIGDGGSDTIIKTIYLYEPVYADFRFTPGSGTAPLAVQFSNQSTGSYTSLIWDFGDGSTSSKPDPVHTFASAGSYLVRLTISGLGGTDQKAVSLSVDAPYWTVYLPNIHKILWPAIVKDDYELYE